MSDAPATRIELRCSMQARAGEIRTVGTAGAVDAFALLELPLPWPSDIGDHPLLEGVAEALAPVAPRLQGLVPTGTAVSSGEYRAALYVRPAGPFRGYRCVERRGPITDLVATCEALVADLVTGTPTGSPTGTADDDMAGDGPQRAPQHELLVCTHGSRDRCCGSMGTVAFASVDQRPDVRLSRTSHLGGHRFAPTALLLPEGTVWAWLDGDVIAGVLDRSVPVADVIDRYRGSTAMPAPAVQAAEAAVFAEVGWSWLDEERSGEVVEAGDDRWTVRIDGTSGSWIAEVVNRGWISQPTCGSDEPSTKADPQLEVVALTPVGR